MFVCIESIAATDEKFDVITILEVQYKYTLKHFYDQYIIHISQIYLCFFCPT